MNLAKKISLKMILTVGALGVLATPMLAAVTITGDPTSTTGANLVRLGNSQDAQYKADETGAGFAYDIYTGRYTVEAGDTTMGSNLVGNTVEGANGGAFNLGDDIYVIGWKSTVLGSDSKLIQSTGDNFLKLDPNGNAGYQPASAPGGPVTSFSNSDAGDVQLNSTRNFGNEFRFSNFRFNDGSGSTTHPYQDGESNSAFTPPLEDLPFRAFGVNTAGFKADGITPETLAVESQVYLFNVTDLNSSSFGGVAFNDIGSDLPFYMFLASSAGKTGVVIPEPTSLALLGLGGLALISRRSRQAARA